MKTSFQKILAALVVLTIAGAVYYRDALEALFLKGGDEQATAETLLSREGLRKVSATESYESDKFAHTITFNVYLDDVGLIRDIETIDTEDPAHNEKLASFSQELLTRVEGKTLSEIGPVDRVGTSSYTTEAFNNALTQLKEQG